MPATPGGRALEGAIAAVAYGQREPQPQPPPAGQELASRNQKLCGQRQAAAHLLQHDGEAGHDEEQEHRHTDAGDHRHQRRVEQRRLDLRAQLRRLLQMEGRLLEHGLQGTARLARLDHRHQDGREEPRVTAECVGQAGAALHRTPDLTEHLGQSLVRSVFGGHSQHAVEGQAGLEQRGGVAGPPGDGGAASHAATGFADRRRCGLHRDRVELLVTQILQRLVARRRFEHALQDLALRGGRPVAEAVAHGATSSRVTRRTSSSVVTPRAALA